MSNQDDDLKAVVLLMGTITKAIDSLGPPTERLGLDDPVGMRLDAMTRLLIEIHECLQIEYGRRELAKAGLHDIEYKQKRLDSGPRDTSPQEAL